MRKTTRALLFVTSAMLAPWALAQDPAPPTAPAPPAPAAAPATAFESIKIVIDGKVKTDGAATLIFTPIGGQAKEVRVTLQKGMDRAEVCRDLLKELQVALGGSPYVADRYDPDKIKVTGKKGAKFGLALGTVTATGLTIQLK